MKSKPEPDPVNSGDVVPDALIVFFQSSNLEDDIKSELIELIRERDSFGREKYGQPLMTKDGRNTIEDARQELGDLIQYVYKALLNGEDIEKVKRLSKGLQCLFEKEGGR